MTVRRGATACTPIPEGAVVSGRDPVTHLPVVSLDGARREPTTEMLAGVALMFDVEGAVLRAHHDWLTRRKSGARKGVPNVLSWFASCCEFRRMIVIEQCTRTGPADRHVEIVEREGIEHPELYV